MEYSRVNPEPDSELEKLIFQMTVEYFGKKPPYLRKMGQGALDGVRKEIREGDVYLAITENEDVAGICIVSPTDVDDRVLEYSVEYECEHFLATLIVTEEYRRQGHALKLVVKAIDGKSGNIILITPERNIEAVNLYKKIGMRVVAEFDQTERSFDSGESFNLRRYVFVGDIAEMREMGM